MEDTEKPGASAAPHFDPNRQSRACENYVSWALGRSARLLGAERLKKSTREAPWRLDVELGSGEARSFVLQVSARGGPHEYLALRAVQDLPPPTPRVYGWDPEGRYLGQPSYLSDFIDGGSLLGPVLAGEPWAEEVFLQATRSLQSITPEQLEEAVGREEAAPLEAEETPGRILEETQAYFTANPDSLARAAYDRLTGTRPDLPGPRFSNGDLYLDNFIVREERLAGVIDFENAGFSDPVYEFLLSFFVHPELRNRGIEERYCRMMGYDPAHLQWYHGLECFELLRHTTERGRPFVHHTSAGLRRDLERWLAGERL